MARFLFLQRKPEQWRTVRSQLAEDGHLWEHCETAAEAVLRLEQMVFDLVIAEADPARVSVKTLARHLRSYSPHLGMIVGGDAPDACAGLADESNVWGFIRVPPDADQVRLTISNALRRRQLELENSYYRQRLHPLLADRIEHATAWADFLMDIDPSMRVSREETIERLINAAGARDSETAIHVRRMSRYAELLARRLGLDEQTAEDIRIAVSMHDVGKIGIPDRILLKKGGLTTLEYQHIKMHARIGYEILSGSESPLIKLAADIALSHHERHDGEGYPNGIAGDRIPYEGQIAAVADVFDALTHRRPYRRAMSIDDALALMSGERGTQFNPQMVDVFVANRDGLREIFDELSLTEQRAPASLPS